ncbi:hypothetical protein [Dyella sp. C9]|uniref:hypothetical protein n=1 Tax=Dyella sp. C9 TaxID=2202154 RepID=UPI000DEF5079|nr:hypothetical protein [Dyella sp. C9]
MQQFIPFEDDWDALEQLRPEMLVPYHVGVPCRHDLAAAMPGAPLAAPSGATSLVTPIRQPLVATAARR